MTEPQKTNEYLTKDQLQAFLYYGYVPQHQKPNVQGLLERYNIKIRKKKEHNILDNLIAKGSNILENVFRELAYKLGNRKVIIPLSGGMDSRAILGGVLNYLPKGQIRTISIGIPGTIDYELGQVVSKHVNVENEPINLNNVGWDESKLTKYASLFKLPTSFLDGFLFSQIFSSKDPSSVYLSGFFGDPLAGSRLPKQCSKSWGQGVKNFNKKNKYSNTTNLTTIANGITFKRPFTENNIISYDEQLDFFVRQRYYIAPLVLLKGTKQIAPFLNPKWVEYMLSLPKAFRKEQLLFKKILQYTYPDLFSLPLKNIRGLPLTAPAFQINFKRISDKLNALGRHYVPSIFNSHSPYINYIDFAKAFRKKEDLRSLAEKCLMDLNERNIVPKNHINKIWNDHQLKKHDHSRLISLLVSLEIFFKSKA